MITEYKVREENLQWLEGRIEKINKKAKKLNQKPIALEVISEEYINEDAEGCCASKILNVLIESEIIKIDGWKFVAVINHTYGAGNIIKKVSDEPIDEKYKTIDGICEHCNTKRKRKETVILRNDEGKEIQVGKSCLKYFLPTDISETLKFMDLLCVIDDEISKLPNTGGDRFFQYINTRTALNCTHRCIKEFGWVSKSNAMMYGKTSTAEIVNKILFGARHRLNNIELEIADDLQSMKREGLKIQEVEDAMNWIKSISEQELKSDYMHNLKVMCNEEYIGGKELNTICSLISTYRKAIERENAKRRNFEINKSSNYVGSIGVRSDFVVTIERVIEYDTMYGTSYVNIMRDDEENIVVWKGSKTAGQIGEKIVIKGTVKEHKEYNNVRQTYISRCKVMEVLEG